jgi:PKD repeat protein
MGVILAISGIVLFNVLGTDSHAALPRDCEDNSIIYCGGIDAAELAQRYTQNKTGDLTAIYSSYGLSAADMTNAGTRAKMGEVHKDGRVTVGGQTVATDALSIGRHDKPGSTVRTINGKKYYERAPSVSFNSESIVAYVFFDANGDFKAAVLTSCGNPVTAKKPVYKCDSLVAGKITRTKYTFTATATAKDGATIVSYTYDFGDGEKTTTTTKTIDHEYTKPGTYTAKLSVTVKVHGTNKTITSPSCEVKIVVEDLPVVPVYACTELKAEKISRLEYAFTGKATAENGATIVDYTIDYGDSNKHTATTLTDVRHTYAKAGTYTATLTVGIKVGDTTKAVTSEACTVKITVTPPEECKPGVPVGDKLCEEVPECKPGIPVNDDRCTPCEVPGKEHLPKNSPDCVTPPVELPHTGPMDMIGSIVGLGSIIAAAAYWYASRRGLMTTLLNR